MNQINVNTPGLAKPITSAKSANDLADMLVAPPENKEGNLLRNKGSEIDLNALYQQSQQNQGFGIGVGMTMMPAAGNMTQNLAVGNFGHSAKNLKSIRTTRRSPLFEMRLFSQFKTPCSGSSLTVAALL